MPTPQNRTQRENAPGCVVVNAPLRREDQTGTSARAVPNGFAPEGACTSWPAIMCKVGVLPQPQGPNRQQ